MICKQFYERPQTTVWDLDLRNSILVGSETDYTDIGITSGEGDLFDFDWEDVL